MSTAVKFHRELGCLLRSRTTLLLMAGTAAGAVWFCLNSSGRTASDAFIINAAKSSAALGALFFALLTLGGFRRDFKYHTDVFILAGTDPLFHQLRRTLALICAAVVTTLATTVFTLPFALIKTGGYFQAGTFAASWFLIFFGALVFSVLLSSGLAMLLRRVEAAFIVMVALILLSLQLVTMYDLKPSYLFFWVQTNADGFSDLVSNSFQIDMILWNRLFCLLGSAAVWLLGLCSARRYGRGVPGSFISNGKRVWPPVLLAAALLLSCFSFAAEPLFDNSVPRQMQAGYESGTGIGVIFSAAEKAANENLLLTDKKAALNVDTSRRTVSGKASFSFSNPGGGPQVLTLKAITGYDITDVFVNGKPATAVRGDIEKENSAEWRIALPAESELIVTLNYSGYPKNNGSLIQKPDYGICNELVWLPPAGFSPSADTGISDNCHFNGTLSLDERLTPVFLNGSAVKRATTDGKTTWEMTSDNALNTGFIAAEYHTKAFEAGGLSVEFRYFAKQEKNIADMDAVNIMKAALDYFTDAYGPLPYQEHLTMLELPASFSGGFAAGTVSAMDETSFAAKGYLPVQSLTPDSGGGVNVLVHEIAHQWWGLSTFPEQDGTSDWSAEGLTCYSTYRFLQSYFGEDYARANFIGEWENGWDTYRNAFYIRHPEYLGILSKKDASNVLSSFYSISLYDIMSLKLLKAEAAAGGPEDFDSKLRELYGKHLGQMVSYKDFLAVTGLSEEVLELA